MAKKKYPKKPKAPKATAGVASHEKYHQRMKDWEADCKRIDRENAEQAKLAQKTADLKAGKRSRRK